MTIERPAQFVPPPLAFPAGLDRAGFLARHWQKKPLVWHGALPGFDNPLSADELAGLACESDVESRLVSCTAPGQFSLQHGPFDDENFAGLGPRDWTLLVQDVDTHLPDLAVVLDRFDFIPSWRIDDLMISFAAAGGSVGPHVDAYDVFLLQAQGSRDWHFGATDAVRECAHPELALVEAFEPVETVRLSAGDMLYLPPGVPHHGIAVDDCMTWSIGFRAPAVRDLVEDFGAWQAERIDAALRYSDPELSLAEAQPGWLSTAAIARVRALLSDALSFSDADLVQWFGAWLTSGKPWLSGPGGGDSRNRKAALAPLGTGCDLARDGTSRWAWHSIDGATWLFVDGQARPVPASAGKFAETLCAHRHLPADALQQAATGADARALLADLVIEGKLHWVQSDANSSSTGVKLQDDR